MHLDIDKASAAGEQGGDSDLSWESNHPRLFVRMEIEVENREGNQDKLLSSIRDLAGSFTASSRDLRDQVAAISG